MHDYTPDVTAKNVLKPATLEKHDLLRKFASGEISSAQIGKRLIDLDKRHRTKKFVLFSTAVGLVVAFIAPFLPVNHSDPSDSTAAPL